MRIPSPGAVVGTAVSAGMGVVGTVTAASEALDQALTLVPRAADLLTRAEALFDRAELAVARAEQTNEGAAAVVETSRMVTRKADRAVEGASGLLSRSDALVSSYEPVARELLPAAKRFTASLQPGEVDAAIALVDRLPSLLNHLDEDVLPMLKQLDRVGPDVHDILEVVEDLRRLVTGLPGVGLLRRFGDDKDENVPGKVERIGARR